MCVYLDQLPDVYDFGRSAQLGRSAQPGRGVAPLLHAKVLRGAGLPGRVLSPAPL